MATITSGVGSSTGTSATTADAERARVDEKIEELKEAIRDLRSARNKLSPISRLPPETLVIILKNVVEPAGPSDDDFMLLDKDSELFSNIRWKYFTKIIHTCQSWRQIVSGCPTLWSRLIFPPCHLSRFDEPARSMEPVLSEMVSKSQAFPRSIRIPVDAAACPLGALPPSLISEIFALERMREFHICRSHQSLKDICDRMTMHNANYMQSLFVRHSGWAVRPSDCPLPTGLLSVPMPRLRYLDIDGFGVQWDLLKSCATRDMVSLKLSRVGYPSRSQFYNVLSRIPNLETLHLEFALPPVSLDMVQGVSLPNLSSCSIHSSPISEYLDFQANVAYPFASTKTYFHPSNAGRPEADRLEDVEASFLALFTTCGISVENPLRSHANLLVELNTQRRPDSDNPFLVLWDEKIGYDISDIPCASEINDPSVTISLSQVIYVSDDRFPRLLPHLSLTGLETICVNGGAHLWDEDQWIGLFNNHKDVTHLYIRSPKASPIFSALSIGTEKRIVCVKPEDTDQLEICLPSLVKVTLEEHGYYYGCETESDTFDGNFDLIYDFLAKRSKHGVPLPKLSLLGCGYMTEEKVKSLEDVVGEVYWDGEAVPNRNDGLDSDSDDSSGSDVSSDGYMY